jgi:hypothetical protein
VRHDSPIQFRNPDMPASTGDRVFEKVSTLGLEADTAEAFVCLGVLGREVAAHLDEYFDVGMDREANGDVGHRAGRLLDCARIA